MTTHTEAGTDAIMLYEVMRQAKLSDYDKHQIELQAHRHRVYQQAVCDASGAWCRQFPSKEFFEEGQRYIADYATRALEEYDQMNPEGYRRKIGLTKGFYYD